MSSLRLWYPVGSTLGWYVFFSLLYGGLFSGYVLGGEVLRRYADKELFGTTTPTVTTYVEDGTVHPVYVLALFYLFPLRSALNDAFCLVQSREQWEDPIPYLPKQYKGRFLLLKLGRYAVVPLFMLFPYLVLAYVGRVQGYYPHLWGLAAGWFFAGRRFVPRSFRFSSFFEFLSALRPSE
jgi:hypothetical protein